MEWAWASGLGRRNVAEGGWRGGREESGTGPKSVLPPVEASQRVVSTVLVCYTARRLGYPAEERKERKKKKSPSCIGRRPSSPFFVDRSSSCPAPGLSLKPNSGIEAFSVRLSSTLSCAAHKVLSVRRVAAGFFLPLFVHSPASLFFKYSRDNPPIPTHPPPEAALWNCAVFC